MSGSMLERETMLELERITFYGEEYCLYFHNSVYVLISNNEVICTYKVEKDNITESKMDTVGIYFFLDEAVKKGKELISNKK